MCSYCIDETIGRNSEDYDEYWGPHPQAMYFHKSNKDDNGPFYGVELEVDNFDDRGKALRDLRDMNKVALVPNLWTKSDGSLNRGIEICFHPRSPSSWASYIKQEFGEVKEIVESAGGRSYNSSTCGLHIHREKRGLSNLTMYKVIILMVDCAEEMQKMAQRKGNAYCSFSQLIRNANLMGNRHRYTLGVHKAWKGGRFADRGALNLQTGKGTYEFRLYRGTLAPDTILGQLGLTDALLQFCEEHLLCEINDFVKHKALWHHFMAWTNCWNNPLAYYLKKLAFRKKFFTLGTNSTNPIVTTRRETICA
jgi:hypothetical protein